jgi:hypothetical protein
MPMTRKLEPSDVLPALQSGAALPRIERVVVLLLVAACGGSGSGASDKPEPIPECVTYQRAVAQCTGRVAAIATQPAALAQSKEERTRLKALCLINTQRLKDACH